MTRVIISLLLFFINLVGLQAQSFKVYVSHGLSKDEPSFRYYKTGLIVLDSIGRELRRTELLYDRIAYCDGFDRAAVHLPLISLEYGQKMGFERGQVWICLDYNLKPVFIFPKNTYHIKIIDEMFLYKDMPGHYSTVGLVDKDGRVIFEAPYERIYLENNMCVGVKDVTEDKESEYKSWIVEFKRKSLEILHVIDLITPKDSSAGLWFEAEDEDEESIFEAILKEDPFQRGLNHAVHFRIDKALESFREALSNEDSIIVRCAEYNIEVLESMNQNPVISK